METIDKDEILFYISKETMQYEAMQKIGRFLTEEELYVAKKGLEWGLMTDIDTWEDCEFLLSRLGYQARVVVTDSSVMAAVES